MSRFYRGAAHALAAAVVAACAAMFRFAPPVRVTAPE